MIDIRRFRKSLLNLIGSVGFFAFRSRAKQDKMFCLGSKTVGKPQCLARGAWYMRLELSIC